MHVIVLALVQMGQLGTWMGFLLEAGVFVARSPDGSLGAAESDEQLMTLRMPQNNA